MFRDALSIRCDTRRAANETPGTDQRAGFVIAGESISGGSDFELRGPARNCLPRRERRGVLQMSSPNDNDLSELYGLDGENVPKFREGGDQALSGGAGALVPMQPIAAAAIRRALAPSPDGHRPFSIAGFGVVGALALAGLAMLLAGPRLNAGRPPAAARPGPHSSRHNDR